MGVCPLRLEAQTKSSSVKIHNEEKKFEVTLNFESGAMLVYNIRFPSGVEVAEKANIIDWQSNQPMQGAELEAQIFFNIDGESYRYDSTTKCGWEKL